VNIYWRILRNVLLVIGVFILCIASFMLGISNKMSNDKIIEFTTGGYSYEKSALLLYILNKIDSNEIVGARKIIKEFQDKKIAEIKMLLPDINDQRTIEIQNLFNKIHDHRITYKDFYPSTR
jgi:hypothetical protein